MTERILGLKRAVPYLRLYKGKTFVVKAGGEVLSDKEALGNFSEQVGILHQLGISLVIVHGGGPQATNLSERLGIPVEMVNGRRVTTPEVLEVAKMVFNGQLNTDLLASLRKYHVPGIGLSGVDSGLVCASKRQVSTVVDAESGETREVNFGCVGDVVSVNEKVLEHLFAGQFVPVVSALAGDDAGGIYNVNADVVAAWLAAALRAEKLIILTDVPGVLSDRNDTESLISQMNREELDRVLTAKAAGGMRVKLEACRDALDRGVRRVHIISGLKPDTLLAEIFTNEGAGTLIESHAVSEGER